MVTGAGGFSGARLVPLLLANGHQVTAATGRGRGRLTSEMDTNPKLTVITGDLASGLPMPDKLDAVIHTAARSPQPGVGTATMAHDNILTTRAVVDAATRAGAEVFINFSTLSVYGQVSVPVVDETTPIVDPDIYGATKRICEELVAEQADRYRALSIRLPGILGRGSVRNWMTGVFDRAKAGDDISVFKPDAPFNNAVHVDDLCAFVADTLVRSWQGHDIVTVGADGETSVRRAVEIVVETLGSSSRIIEHTSERTSYTVSSARAKARYGYESRNIETLLHDFASENAED